MIAGPYPFSSPSILAQWAADHLQKQGIDEVGQWRMAEGWEQVELFRAFATRRAGVWINLGEYEQPYSTDLPRPSRNHDPKWVDLNVVLPEVDRPWIGWIELKDLGRNRDTLANNARGLGYDLAALYGLNLVRTGKLWEQYGRPDKTIDKGRWEEWKQLAQQWPIERAQHIIGQIVLVHRELVASVSDETLIKERWLNTFRNRAKLLVKDVPVKYEIDSSNIDRASTADFVVY